MTGAALLALGLTLAPPAAADQCAPPGEASASALPTNLAAAAKGPEQDKYSTATVEPLDTVNVDALGLGTPGTLTVGTLSDAPPSITIPIGTSMAEAEFNLIMATLEHFNHHKERTAAALGVSLKTLYNRLKEYSGER